MDSSREVGFDFYGLRVAAGSDSAELLEDIHRDFSYFRADTGDAAVTLELIAGPGPRDALPRRRASLLTPRNIVYRDGDVSYLDYFGRALAICEAADRTVRIYSPERDLAHEVAFLTILSRVGKHLDAIGLHRVHALGVEAGGRGVLILLPMSGGKTTLALRLLGSGAVKLLSEDSPLLSRRGEVLPFPLRIGVRVGDEPPGVPGRYCRTVRRMESGPKTLIDVAYFRDRIGGPCPVGAILLGERWLAGPSFIRPARRRRAIRPFLKNAVVGLGLYQGVEFVLERSAWEVLGKAGVALGRLRTSLGAIRRANVYRFGISPDRRQSAEVLENFLREFSSRPRP